MVTPSAGVGWLRRAGLVTRWLRLGIPHRLWDYTFHVQLPDLRCGPGVGGTNPDKTCRFLSGTDGVPRRRRRRPSMPPEGGRTDRAHDAPSVRPRATFRAARSRPAGGTAVAAFAPMAATVHSIKGSMLDCCLEVQCTRRSLAPKVTGDAGAAPLCSPAIRLAYAAMHSEHRGTRCSCSRCTTTDC